LTASDAASRADTLFASAFARPPAVRASATGRVNLIGDHIDYAGGTVLPMAIAARTHVAAAPADEDDAVSEWRGDEGWRRYAFGVLAELRARGLPIPPMSLAVASDVPVGAGLSSSAALEIAVARAAMTAAGVDLAPREVAELCQRAEHRHAGVPCGIMDQWCVAHAAGGEAIALECDAPRARPISLPNGLRIEIVDSGVRHALRDGGYAARRADVDEAAAALRIAHLARLPRERWREIDGLPERIARRARHVVTEQARVEAAIDALGRRDLARFGALLVESHASLRDDFEVSVPELDRIVDDAMSRGALGARMTGGGFGGCALVAWQ
jgi:galactokinase